MSLSVADKVQPLSGRLLQVASGYKAALEEEEEEEEVMVLKTTTVAAAGVLVNFISTVSFWETARLDASDHRNQNMPTPNVAYSAKTGAKTAKTVKFTQICIVRQSQQLYDTSFSPQFAVKPSGRLSFTFSLPFL